MKFKKLYLVSAILLSAFTLNAEEIELKENDTELNVYTGMFDFSDDGKKST